MSVKEIRELEGELKEVSVDESVVDRGDWEEGDFVEEEEKEFSIGDTMLARGETKERWSNESLEDVVEWEASENFEGEEDVGFSYEPANGNGSGGLYGSSDAGDLYGSGKSASLYNNNEGTKDESDFYNTVGISGGKKVGVVNYKVAEDGGKKKKRRGGKSGLESGAKRKGVSLI
ncbi:hypothetical protein K8R30_04920 [archaeon]|nr:hypothetical protein [archaeon]